MKKDIDTKRIDTLKKIALKLQDILLNDRQLCDFELIVTGAFSPLKGYMVSSDYESVLDRMRLQDGTLWPLPICLDISEMQSKNIEAGQSIALRDSEGFLLAVMHVLDIWPIKSWGGNEWSDLSPGIHFTGPSTR